MKTTIEDINFNLKIQTFKDLSCNIQTHNQDIKSSAMYRNATLYQNAVRVM